MCVANLLVFTRSCTFSGRCLRRPGSRRFKMVGGDWMRALVMVMVWAWEWWSGLVFHTTLASDTTSWLLSNDNGCKLC
ncbi:hypothetical protein Hamer_G014538, partial [Homarus americanus]